MLRPFATLEAYFPVMMLRASAKYHRMGKRPNDVEGL